MGLLHKPGISVASRIHTAFIIAAALPLIALALASYMLVTDRLQERALFDARQLAKGLGMDVFERLDFVARQLALLANADAEGGAPLIARLGLDLDLGARVESLFLISDEGDFPSGAQSDVETRDAISTGLAGSDATRPLLIMAGSPGQRRIFMLVAMPATSGGEGWLGATLGLEHLWDTAGIVGRPERICVIADDGIPVYCNHARYDRWLAAAEDLLSQRSAARRLPHDSGEAALTAAWPLFMKPHYQFERWTVLVGVPESMAFESIQTFGRLFAGSALLAVLVAVLFGRRLIKRNLRPLTRLNAATAELAAGHYDHRLQLDSGDEFEQLGDAFDGMARQIGAQIRQLEILARLDAMLRAASGIDEALVAAQSALAACQGGGRVALLCDEHWAGVDEVHCLPFGANYADQVVSLRGVQIGGDALNALRERLGVDLGEPIHLCPVVEGPLVSASIVLRGADPPCAELLARVADALAITLDRLVAERRLVHQTRHDWLTGLPNRMRVNEVFDAWVAAAAADGTVIGMLLLNIDRFKQINDSMGHALGDQLLGQIAVRLGDALPEDWLLGRFSSDQFVVMTPDRDPATVARRVSALHGKLLDELDRAFALGQRDVRLSATCGAAIYPKDAASFEGMLQALDAAGFAAKATRRGGLLFFSAGMRDASLGRMETEQALKVALARGELKLHYQPVVDARTLRLCGVEALMRWQRPGAGLLLPGAFIDVAEDSGLIGPMGQWAISEACRQMRLWHDGGLPIATVNVNVSAAQLADPALENAVRSALGRTGLPPGCLTLEVTETALIDSFDESLARLGRLRSLGVRIMIDDFGTGYASLKYLKVLPVDGLKIDRMFVKDLAGNSADQAIIAAVVSLARHSGYKLVAEGVETPAQADRLREAGVPLLQGFLYSKGLPPEELLAWSRAAGLADP